MVTLRSLRETLAGGETVSADAELVEQRTAPEIYDEDGAYLESFTDEVYAAALAQVLENAQDYYTTAQFEVTLRYLDGAWRMQTSPALFTALMGGV